MGVIITVAIAQTAVSTDEGNSPANKTMSDICPNALTSASQLMSASTRQITAHAEVRGRSRCLAARVQSTTISSNNGPREVRSYGELLLLYTDPQRPMLLTITNSVIPHMAMRLLVLLFITAAVVPAYETETAPAEQEGNKYDQKPSVVVEPSGGGFTTKRQSHTD